MELPPQALFADAVLAQLDGLQVKVISFEHLLSNKQAAGRPQDLLDVTFLQKVRAHAQKK